MDIRIDEPTPGGGAYSVASYTNEKGDDCGPEEATIVYIREYAPDGTLVNETIGTCKSE